MAYETFKKQTQLGVERYGIYDAEYYTTRRAINGWWHGRRSIQNRNPDGNLYVRYLYWNGGRWNWNYNWLEGGWSVVSPAALGANQFASLPRRYVGGVFVF
ncbi:MAG: hypothetical protein Q8P01_00100 [bacterium]|nr:hypothetical protein [bacterium]